MSTKRAIARHRPLLGALTVVGALALVACTGDGAPSRTSLATPQAATATPAPADPDLGELYRRNGQYEEAVAVFRAVVDRAAEPARRQARLSLALTYLDAGQHEDALPELSAHLGGGPPPPEAARARFMRARALAALDRFAEAAREYGRYIEGGGPAAPYARLGRAEALTLLGRPAESAAELEQALAADLPPVTNARALLLLAQSAEQAGDSAGARRWYERLFRESDSPADEALALWRQAELARRAGDTSWVGAARDVMADYPGTASAVAALEALEAAGEAVDGYRAGVVLYRHFRDREAVQVLEENLESPSPSHRAESYYYVAVAEERLGNEDEALAAYERSLVEDRQGPLADDAAWWRARLLELEGRLPEAQAGYTELILRYGGSRWVPEARFRRGLISYKEADFAQATYTWRATLTSSQPPEEHGRNLLWLAKAEEQLGEDAAAREHLEELAALPDAGYYALRAIEILGDAVPEGKRIKITALTSEWAAADAWAASLGPAVVLPYDPTALSRWERAAELRAVGLYDESQAELDVLLAEEGTTPGRLYALARAFDAAGLTYSAARAATRLLDGVSPVVAEAAPPEVWRLAYPAGFASLVETTSRREGVPAALLLAVIRQESFFDARAGSPAGALGLTQVIPSTGEDIAADLGVASEFRREDLFRPLVSVRFGARYLRRQLEAFDGSVPEALAAYNGGPGNSQRWSAAAGGDPDLFLEEIDLPETRAYLQLVSENLARYREIYAAP